MKASETNSTHITTGAKKPPSASLLGSVASLWALLRAGAGRSRERLAVEVMTIALADVFVLYSINQAIADYRNGEFPTRELFLFVVAVVASTVAFYNLLKEASQSFNAELARSTLRIVDKLRRLDLAEFEALGGANGADVLARLTTDAERVLRSSAVLIEVLKASGLVVLALLYFMSRSVEAAVLGFGALAMLTVFTGRKNATLLRGLARAEALKAEMLATYRAMVRGIKQVKVHAGRREALLSDMRGQAGAFAAERKETLSRYYAQDALGFTFFFSIQAFVVFGFPLVFATDKTVTTDLLMSLWYVSSAMGLIFKSQPQLAEASGALARIQALEQRLTAAAGASAVSTDPDAEGFAFDAFEAISLRGISYQHRQYDRSGAPLGGGFQIGPLDLTIHRGEIVFVTGNNGSGKSTFLKLLTGLYTPDAGRLSLDERELPPPVPQGYRDLFGVLLSDFVVFERLYGMEDVDPARVQRLLEEMELSHKVSFDLGRFSTVDLSTGQRKRLAMVVALLQDRPIYVFDEWAADQDPEFRAVFYRRLLPELKQRGKTVIAVTHDDHYFSIADRRIHFQNGRAVSA